MRVNAVVACLVMASTVSTIAPMRNGGGTHAVAHIAGKYQTTWCPRDTPEIGRDRRDGREVPTGIDLLEEARGHFDAPAVDPRGRDATVFASFAERSRICGPNLTKLVHFFGLVIADISVE